MRDRGARGARGGGERARRGATADGDRSGAQADAHPRDAWSADRAARCERDAGLAAVPDLARAALAFTERRGWRSFGYARPGDCCRERLDRTSRWLQDQAALGRGLGEFQALEAALLGRDGPVVGRVAATAIARIATPESIAAWIARARASTVRALLEEIRACNALGVHAPLEPDADQPLEPGADQPLEPDADPGGSRDAPAAASRRTLDEPEPEIADPVEVRLAAPLPVRAAFEEVFDLHRAVSGCEASVASFAEALAAEAAAGPAPPDAHLQPLATGTPRSRIEHALARATGRWAYLAASDASDAGDGSDASVASDAGDAGDASDRGDANETHRAGTVAAAAQPHATPDPDSPVAELGAASSCTPCPKPEARAVCADARAIEARLREALDRERVRERRIGLLLYEMSQRDDWKTLGFASAGHYAVERLGMARRTAESHAGIVRALRRLPIVKKDARRIGLESAWLLHRILGPRRCGPLLRPERETDWSDHAHEVTVKRLRDDWRALRLRDLDPNPAAGTEPPRPATDAEWLASLYRAPGTSRARLRDLRLPGLDDPFAPTSSLASADVFVRLRLPVDVAQLFLAAVESARLRARVAAEAIPESLDAHQSPVSLRAARTYVDRARRVPAWVGLLSLLEDYAQTWDDPESFPERDRTRQTTYSIAGWRCQAPGCTARCHIEDHHIHYRSHQGSNERFNHLCLCRWHHQQGEHGGLARCRGKAPLGVVWRLGTPALASWFRNERKLERRRR